MGPVQGLDLRLLVDAQHHGVVGGMEVKSHDISDLLDEEGVVGELERARQMRLDAKEREPALHGGLGDALGGAHQAHAPVLGVGRLLLQGAADHLGDLLVVVAAGTTGAKLVMQALNAEFEEASTPLADGLGRSPDPFGHCPVGEALGTGQDHAGSQGPSREADWWNGRLPGADVAARR